MKTTELAVKATGKSQKGQPLYFFYKTEFQHQQR